MRFELRPAYEDWPENDRKTLHVDQEAFDVIKESTDVPGEPSERLMRELPLDVIKELQKPMYAGALLISGMNVIVDL